MKKIVLSAMALMTGGALCAQSGDITSNRGENWLSQEGDWALGFDAQPFFSYVGNLFNGSTNNTGPSMWSPWMMPGDQYNYMGSGVVIVGKKLMDANTAYRGKLRLGFGSWKETELVNAIPQPNPAPFPPTTVENTEKHSFNSIAIGGGLEKRVGASRVVGVYGGEAMIGLGGSKTTYEYGNALSAQNPVGQRPTEEKRGSTFGFGLNAFAGVEWFFAPKMSVSGEYTWGLMLSSTGFGKTSNEGWDPTANNGQGASRTWEVEGPTGKENLFAIDTGVSGASIIFNFYFQ
jgi:hypothetical protein